MTNCDACGVTLTGHDWLCPGCHRFRGVPCASCAARLELRQAACACGATTPAPESLLAWARRHPPRPAPSGPSAFPQRVHLAPVRRLFPVVLEQLLALTPNEVRRLAGEPDAVVPGAPTPGPRFGLTPRHVARERIVETWSYANADDAHWLLWWVGAPLPRVGEVASAPVEAVF